MRTIAILSNKGGTGKTTLALNLAGAAELSGRAAVVIDLDPQASAKGWHDGRTEESPVVVSVQAVRLQEALRTAVAHGADIALIDTAPHSESAALAAARAADLVLIPCRSGILDLRAIGASRDICALAKVKAVAVLNAVPPRGGLADEAEAAIAQYGLSPAPVRIGQRMAFVHSLTAGQTAVEFEPRGKAAHEIKTLYKWICENVHSSTLREARSAR